MKSIKFDVVPLNESSDWLVSRVDKIGMVLIDEVEGDNESWTECKLDCDKMLWEQTVAAKIKKNTLINKVPFSSI